MQFEKAHYTSETGKWWDRLSFEKTTSTVELAVRQAVDLYSNHKVIAFNLDGYDPQELFGSRGEDVASYTNFEVHLLLSDRRLFLATRWYCNCREMNPGEAEAYWAPVIATLAVEAMPPP